MEVKMLIKLIEPLNVNEELIISYKEKLESMGHEFIYYMDKTTDPKELEKRSEGADIVMIANNPYPGAAFEANDKLKLINVAFTGFDHVDCKTAKDKGIKICNASGYSNTSVAELVIGLNLNIYRKINSGDFGTRNQRLSAEFKGKEIKGKTVGIIGTGNIGLETAKLFKAFGADVIAYSRTEKKEALDMGITYYSIEELLEKSDIVSIHLPLNDHTKNFLDEEKISLMKEDAILINCARGPIVDNKALAQALNDEKIAAAGIDVFDMEPPIPADYPLLSSKNTLLTPHVAYLTEESMVRRAHIAFDNTISFIEGQEKNIVKL